MRKKWAVVMGSIFNTIGTACVVIIITRKNWERIFTSTSNISYSKFETWGGNFCDSQLPIRWDYSCFDPTTKIVCRVGSALNMATYLTFVHIYHCFCCRPRMQFDWCYFFHVIVGAHMVTLLDQKDMLLRQTPKNTWYNEIELCILDVDTILGSRVN